MRAAWSAGVVAGAAFLAAGAAGAQTSEAVAGESNTMPAMPPPASLTFRASGGGDEHYHVEATHAGGTFQCETPCAQTVDAGELRLRVSGPASFEQVLSVGEGASVVTLHRRSDLMFYGGIVLAALGVVGVVAALAWNPMEGSNDLAPAALGIGGIVLAGVGFTAVANAGSEGAEVGAAGVARRDGWRLRIAGAPVPGGAGIVAVMRY